MNETFCNYSGKRDETIVAYLYGEMQADERAAFDRHLVACAPCRAELVDLRDVRSELARWGSPEPAAHIPFNIEIPRQPGVIARARSIPVWAQAIAATLVLGVAAGVANLDVSYSQAAGLSIRTGWRHPAAATTDVTATPVAVAQGPASPAPWTADLAALERDLRSVLEQRPVASTAASSGGDEAVLRRVRQLVQDSERRQESELALRVAEAVREIQMQRQADLVKIDRTLGLMQNRTGLEVMRTQRQMNSLAQQVSQRP
jgi:CheY-like chemotaxis protein